MTSRKLFSFVLVGVLAVAGGLYKADAIRAVLASGVLSALIVDEATAARAGLMRESPRRPDGAAQTKARLVRRAHVRQALSVPRTSHASCAGSRPATR